MVPKEVAKEQGELLAEAPGTPHMEVRATLSGWLAEVALGALRILGTEHIAKVRKVQAIAIHGLQLGDGDLDVDDGLGDETWESGRPNVVDTLCHLAKRCTEVRCL